MVLTLAAGASAKASDLRQLLIDAAMAGDSDLVSQLIQLGADASATDEKGWSALAIAAELDEPEVAKVLINAGARTWTSDRATSPIAIASITGSSAVIDVLISDALPPLAFNDALSVAATRGDPLTVEHLLKSANLAQVDVVALKKGLMTRYKVEFSAGGDIDPAVVVVALRACRDDGLYQTARCISEERVHNISLASVEIPPQDCDVLAAAPTDADRPSSVRPVYVEKIDADAAIAACTIAIGTYPRVPRFALELGRAYLVQKNHAEAVHYFRKAVEMGSKFALVELASEYADGNGVPLDAKKSLLLLAKAADLGDLPGLTGLGLAYEMGVGVTVDLTKALSLYRAAANRGGVDAMQQIGLMYQLGTGVERDVSTAFVWFKMAADAGYVPAISQLASAYESGQGTTKNLEEAMKLYKVADADGDPMAAQSLKRIAAGPGFIAHNKIDFSSINGLNSNLQPVTVKLLTSTPINIAGHTVDVVISGGSTAVYANSYSYSQSISGKHKDLQTLFLQGTTPPDIVLHH